MKVADARQRYTRLRPQEDEDALALQARGALPGPRKERNVPAGARPRSGDARRLPDQRARGLLRREAHGPLRALHLVPGRAPPEDAAAPGRASPCPPGWTSPLWGRCAKPTPAPWASRASRPASCAGWAARAHARQADPAPPFRRAGRAALRRGGGLVPGNGQAALKPRLSPAGKKAGRLTRDRAAAAAQRLLVVMVPFSTESPTPEPGSPSIRHPGPGPSRRRSPPRAG